MILYRYRINLHKCMGLFFIIAMVILISGCQSRMESKKMPVAQKGVLDLTTWDFEKDGAVDLKGDYEFYWKQLVSPDENDSKSALTGYIGVPSVWDTVRNGDKNLPAFGYATYRLKVKLKDNIRSLGIKTSGIASAYKLYVNGKVVSEAGKTGKTKSEMKAANNPEVCTFETAGNQLDIVIQVSNFMFHQGGLWTSFTLGSAGKVKDMREMALISEALIAGALLIIALYYMCFFILRKQDKEMLYLSLACMVVGIRTLFVGEEIINDIFPNLNWYFCRKVEYLSVYWGYLCFMMFYNSLFPNEVKNKVIAVSKVVFVICTINIIFFPLHIYARVYSIYQGFVAVNIIILCAGLLLAAIRRRANSIVLLLGAAVFVVTIFNDLMLSLQIIRGSVFLSSFGILALIFSMAVILSRKFSQTLDNNERLSAKATEDKKRIEETLEAVTKTSKSIILSITSLYQKLKSVVATSNEISEAMHHNAKEIEEQNLSINQSVDGLNGILNEFKSVRNKSGIMNNISVQTKEVSTDGSIKMQEIIQHMKNTDELVSNLSEVMTDVNEKSNQIYKMLDMIKQISKETKLLSLNASIEADKASEHGKGFSVIATEVRKLSDMSAKFAADITDVLQEIKESMDAANNKALICCKLVNEDTMLVDEGYKAFGNISNSVDTVNTESKEVYNQSEEVAEIAAKFFEEFKGISDLLGHTSASIEQVTSASESQVHDITAAKTELEKIKEEISQLERELTLR